MKTMNTCPCCSTQLLRHARHGGVYWFCPYCWQEMPDLEAMISRRNQRVKQLQRLIDSNPPTTRKSALVSEYSTKYANTKKIEERTFTKSEDNLNPRLRHLSDFPAPVFS